MSLKYTHTKTNAYVPLGRAYEPFVTKLATRFRDYGKATTRKRVFSSEYPDFGGSLGTAYVNIVPTIEAKETIQRTYRAKSII